jgi:tetratricopeptide (TPR) repeat protein
MGGEPRFQAPMIGRASDLARLQSALDTVRRHNQPRVALVTGEAGLGKSRLVAEFRRSVNSPAEVRIFQGNCLTYARSTPLRVVADLLRDIVQLSEADPDDVQQDILAAYLDQLGLTSPDILPYLVHLLGLAQPDAQTESRLRLLKPAMLQRQTHAALRQLFLALTRQAPTVLIFEDLHWLDPASSDFLEYLIQTIDEAPLLLLLVSREAERETTLRSLLTALEQEPARLVDLKLQALTAVEGQLLADQLIPQTTAEAGALKQHLVARTEGNPFYIEETIRMLIDEGGLERTPADTGWQVTPQAYVLLKSVPGTVKGLILARFDRLPDSLRWTLQKAAVLGASFPVSLLQELAQVSSDTLAGQLSRLEARQFLTGTPFRSAPGYTFRHALVQETIYQTLLNRDRRKIHTQVGQAIGRSTFWLPEEQAEILAYHFTESDSPASALPYLIRAADNAAGRCAFETAIGHYRQAMTLLPEQPAPGDQQFFHVRLGLGRVLKFVGELAEAHQVLSDALEQLSGFDQAAYKPILIGNLRQLADVRQREGKFDQAMPYLVTGLDRLGPNAPQEEPGLWRSLLDRMAWIRFRQGQLDEAWSLADQATAGQVPADTADPIRLASLYNTQGGVAWQQGRLDESIAFVQRSLDLYEKVGYSWGVAVAYGNLGLLHYSLGNWPRAIEYFERAYAVHQIIGNPEGQAVISGNLAVLHLSRGEHEQARQELETNLSIQARLGDSWGMAQTHVNLAHLALVQARFAETVTHAQTALALSESIGSAEIRVPVHWCLAMVRAEQNGLQQGFEYARRALEMAQEAQFTEGEIDSLRVLGILQIRAGQYDQAKVNLHESLELSLQQKVRYRQGLALYELGRLYQRRSQIDQATAEEWRARALESLHEAADIFETLGAGHDLYLARLALDQL